VNGAVPKLKEAESATAGDGSLLHINIGCGTSAAEGWYNIDNSPTIWLSRIPLASRVLRLPAWPKDVHRHNVLKGLPFAGESVHVVYSSHTFEHFTYEQSLALTKDCFRVLKPGGTLRIVVPDLGLIVRDYLTDPSPLASHRMIQRLLLGHTWRDMLHPGAHHSQMFDARSLLAMVAEAGFTDAKQSSFRESDIADLALVEPEERCSESLYVEARKH
jgi:predicted SAM-dependent methyltransferase